MLELADDNICQIYRFLDIPTWSKCLMTGKKLNAEPKDIIEKKRRDYLFIGETHRFLMGKHLKSNSKILIIGRDINLKNKLIKQIIMKSDIDKGFVMRERNYDDFFGFLIKQIKYIRQKENFYLVFDDIHKNKYFMEQEAVKKIAFEYNQLQIITINSTQYCLNFPQGFDGKFDIVILTVESYVTNLRRIHKHFARNICDFMTFRLICKRCMDAGSQVVITNDSIYFLNFP